MHHTPLALGQIKAGPGRLQCLTHPSYCSHVARKQLHGNEEGARLWGATYGVDSAASGCALRCGAMPAWAAVAAVTGLSNRPYLDPVLKTGVDEEPVKAGAALGMRMGPAAVAEGASPVAGIAMSPTIRIPNRGTAAVRQQHIQGFLAQNRDNNQVPVHNPMGGEQRHMTI